MENENTDEQYLTIEDIADMYQTSVSYVQKFLYREKIEPDYARPVTEGDLRSTKKIFAKSRVEEIFKHLEKKPQMKIQIYKDLCRNIWHLKYNGESSRHPSEAEAKLALIQKQGYTNIPNRIYDSYYKCFFKIEKYSNQYKIAFS